VRFLGVGTFEIRLHLVCSTKAMISCFDLGSGVGQNLCAIAIELLEVVPCLWKLSNIDFPGNLTYIQVQYIPNIVFSNC
jgi:hypothetical protein